VEQAASGNYDEALADYTEALQLQPNYASVYYHRSLAKEQLKDVSGAQEDLQHALPLNPNLQR
jgi:tetratricopeptide (TPR) repeat protein